MTKQEKIDAAIRAITRKHRQEKPLDIYEIGTIQIPMKPNPIVMNEIKEAIAEIEKEYQY